MPSRKLGTVWEAKPHTIAKITILETYLLAWFQIMGRTKQGQDLLYVDGFAGPGEYRNFPKGSPLAALEAAKTAISLTAGNWIAGDVHCAFIELDKKRCDHLRERIKPFDNSEKLRIHVLRSSFVDGLSKLKSQVPTAFKKSHPLFVFIDPFGATGAPFWTVAEILSTPCSEALINLDADGIIRIFQAQAGANYEVLLNDIFGDESWKDSFLVSRPFPDLCCEVLSLYKANLRKLPDVKYVFPFEMRACAGSLNYYLVFASQHPLGLEKMKEAMKKIDRDGDYCFSDANINQEALFRFDDPALYSSRLFKQFRGRRVSYSELRDFALNETPFINPKSMLKDLEAKNLIEVRSKDPKRRKGTFNEEKIIYVEFEGGKQGG